MKLLKSMSILILILSNFACAQGSHTGGGDEKRFYFEEGKNFASNLIRQLKLTANSNDEGSDVIAWLSTHQAKLLEELKQSQIVWTAAPQATCAQTDMSPESPVVLSFNNCFGVSSKEEAAKLLIHEVSHHLGVGNSAEQESFADRLAIAVFDNWASLQQKTIPLCEDENNVLSSAIFGSWKSDVALTKRLDADASNFDPVSFEKDLSVINVLKPFGGCAVTAGYFNWSKNEGSRRERQIFVLTVSRGNPIVRYYHYREVEREWKANFNNVAITRGRNRQNDLLFIGGDHLSEPFTAYVRNITK